MAASDPQSTTADSTEQTAAAASPNRDNAPPAKPRQAPPAHRATDASIKDTLESIVIALAIAFVFRAFVVEAFLIPTGSMAPTLLGQHLRVVDPETGYRFAIGVDPPTTMLDHDNGLNRAQTAVSPMTGRDITLDKNTHARPGDRILVLKYLYGIAEPRRWDVVVFKAPHDPQTNFIKRLVGLPNEAVALLDGNVYVRPLEGDTDYTAETQDLDAGWRIARKTDRPNIQRSVFAPVYDSWYAPAPPVGNATGPRVAADWSPPWRPDGPTAQRWTVQGARHYRYVGDDPGSLRFDFEEHGYDRLDARYPYNQFKTASNREPIEDIRLAVDLTPDRFGLSVELTTTSRVVLDDEWQAARLAASIDGGGRVQLLATAPQAAANQPPTVLAEAATDPLPPGRITALELWHVDHETVVWVNGRRVLTHRDDVSLRRVIDGPPPALLPEVAIGIDGGPATLQRVVLERDLYYAGEPRGEPARGAIKRRDRSPGYTGNPIAVGPNRFWCIGDNSPQSDDGRFWTYIDATARQRFFDPEEFADGRSPVGLVPRDMMVGRAFFVYFPAPLARRTDRPGLVPNLADMRFIR
ncbi:MAG: signal peptidase I [Planctomycetota bacterium]